jgi:hypothetical protein
MEPDSCTEDISKLVTQKYATDQTQSSEKFYSANTHKDGETRNAYNILIGKPERKRLHERLRRTWDDNGILK